MAVQVTLDNTIGVAFLGLLASYLRVIHNSFSRHPDQLPSCNQSHGNFRRSNTFVLPQLYQRLDVPKNRGESYRKHHFETHPDVITLSRLGFSCRRHLMIVRRNPLMCNDLQYPRGFAYGIHNPCRIFLPYRQLWKPQRP